MTARIVMPLLAMILVATACQTTASESESVPTTAVIETTTIGPGPPVTTTGTMNTTSVPPSSTTTTVPEVVVELPPGTWQRTNPDLGGLHVDTRDMIWDGDNFYLLTRIGFGDVVVWQSTDGVEWARHSQIGTASTVDGPQELTSVSGQLIAAGWRGGTALVWVHEGDGGWTEVVVGSGTIGNLVFFKGKYIALGQAFYPPDAGQSPGDNYPMMWSSADGYTWTEIVGAGDFESVRALHSLVVGPAGLLSMAISADRPFTAVSAVLISTNGIDWVAHQPTGLDFEQVNGITGNASGYAAYGFMPPEFVSPILVSSDGVNWRGIDSPDVPDGEFVDWSGISMLGDLIVVSGSTPDNGEYLPRIWAYRGGGLWDVLGTGDWYSEPGNASGMVSGNGRLVVRAQTGGAAQDPWAIFTFVPESSG